MNVADETTADDASTGDPSPCLLYGVKQAMRQLALSRSALYNEVRSGRLRSFTRGRQRLFSHAALLAYIEQLDDEGRAASLDE